jgi:hypothetical protein
MRWGVVIKRDMELELSLGKLFELPRAEPHAGRRGR